MGQLAKASTTGLPIAIGRYQVTKRLGKGAMGIVYGARDEQVGRDVAVKVLIGDVEAEPETRARFFREAQITSKLLHRNIVTVFDIGEDDGRLFIVMEMLKGRTLGDFLKESEPVPLEQKLDLMLQICEGLSVAHASGIVHRDIKPGNLFVLADGGLKIVDFGVARLASSNLTASGLIIGTPDYMSPEQARGREVDSRSDIFSAAAVFYFMLSGRKAFEGAELPVVLQKVVREDPPPLREDQAPTSLARIITKALTKDPNGRYQKAADMAADLVRFKRYLDAETRQIAAAARTRFDEIRRVVVSIREQRAAMEMAPPVDVDQREADICARYPFLSPRPDGIASAAGPLRRSRLAEMSNDLQSAMDALASDSAPLRVATAATAKGEAALEAGDCRAALDHFTRAAHALTIESPRIARGYERARELTRTQQARADRTRALFVDAQAAAGVADWSVVIDRCEQVLGLEPAHAGAAELVIRARAAAAAEAADRRQRIERLVTQADAATVSGRFEKAERALLDASALDADSRVVKDAQARLADAQAKAAALDADARRAAHAADAERRAAEVDRREKVRAQALEAEARWNEGDPTDALRLADLALEIDRGHPVALRIQALARARLREMADTAAREADAAQRATRGAELLGAGKLDKALRELQNAQDLDPGNARVKTLLADVRQRQSAVAAAEIQAAAERERARSVDKILKGARTAHRSGDYTRAIDEAESALRVDARNADAGRVLAEARAAHAARMAEDEDDTVSMAADADDTAVVRREGLVKVLATIVGDWAAGLRRRLR
jgi:predicted Ser/Thr protein kinase